MDATCKICGGPYRTEGSWGHWERIRVRDSLYVGPGGHSHPRACFDCWVYHWEAVARQIRAERPWERRDWAFWLIACGWTRKDAAALVGRHYTTIWRWMREVRKNPQLLPDWVQGKGPSRVGTM